MKNSKDACRAIERLVGGSFGMDMEWILFDKREKDLDPRLKSAARIITDIYMITHAENGKCNHESWENLKYEILKQPEK